MKLITPLILELNLPYIINANTIKYCGKFETIREEYYDGEVYYIDFDNKYDIIYARKKGQKFGAYFTEVYNHMQIATFPALRTQILSVMAKQFLIL